mgnify:CR=1 FL=1
MAAFTGCVTIDLDAEHAEKLRVLAERTHMSPENLASSLLSSALDQAAPSPSNVTRLLDGIDGAFERAQAGLADLETGRVVALEDL